MIATVEITCPECEGLLKQTITVPEPNFNAEQMKDSGVEFCDVLCCEHCKYEINYSGSNSFIELFLTFSGVLEGSFQYSEPSYVFEKYDQDAAIESDGVHGVITSRKIVQLFHFTKIENLDAILKYGLIPRAQLQEGDFEFTDVYRADGFLGANCVSVSFPQYKMLFIKQIEDKQQNWVVLELSPELLLANENNSAFFEQNAASGGAKKEIISNRKSATAFEKMFADIKELPSRKKRGLPDNYPTDPQAEILVFNQIGREYIVAAHFADSDVLEKNKDKLNGMTAKVSPRLFANRKDHIFL
ncbi:DarT ssDNA thymidine ADP-ribosyltransferase family protein [Photobacterium kishitanii]|uniref:DarT domain-containing protein n=1 Tax=Photobacterium kishitanii TaxID=318456 RepID=A0A2T3KLP2_9GAMM|nr:DarT ssDNA thymidine ADP-ribosyltransferase family protein [Photobacterium kishitanii]PSV00622.1 hypothetical protein C9J27_05655 [Photobacterium kishitanii]